MDARMGDDACFRHERGAAATIRGDRDPDLFLDTLEKISGQDRGVPELSEFDVPPGGAAEAVPPSPRSIERGKQELEEDLPPGNIRRRLEIR
jgi:hypothetical protein